MAEMSTGELKQALLQCEAVRHDFAHLYEAEYKRCEHLQKRINLLKSAQRKAHLEFRGCVE